MNNFLKHLPKEYLLREYVYSAFTNICDIVRQKSGENNRQDLLITRPNILFCFTESIKLLSQKCPTSVLKDKCPKFFYNYKVLKFSKLTMIPPVF